MERKLPKNVRQIGNVSDNPKIYIEDYVDTFLVQLCEQSKEKPQGAFLIGDIVSEEGEDYVFVYGAIRMQDWKQEGTDLKIGDEVWKRAYEDCKQYFEDGEMIGWFLTVPDKAFHLSTNMKKIHQQAFPKENTILILEEPIEQEEAYYASKYNELMNIAGHYVYYEKNPCMQNYMISCRKKNGVSPSETVEDRAAKDFRSLVRTREEAKEQKKVSKFLYVSSGLLLLLVIAMGITTINNVDKMKAVEQTMAQLGEEKKETTVKDKKKDVGQVVTTTPKESKTEDISKEKIQSAEQINDGTQDVPKEDSEKPELSQDEMPQGDTEQNEDNGNNGIYVVEEGDTLAMISQKCYGNINHVDAICRMNGLSDGNLIYIGQKLLLP